MLYRRVGGYYNTCANMIINLYIEMVYKLISYSGHTYNTILLMT